MDWKLITCANQLCTICTVQCVFGIISCTQQLVKRISINGEMPSLYIAFQSYFSLTPSPSILLPILLGCVAPLQQLNFCYCIFSNLLTTELLQILQYTRHSSTQLNRINTAQVFQIAANSPTNQGRSLYATGACMLHYRKVHAIKTHTGSNSSYYQCLIT